MTHKNIFIKGIILVGLFVTFSHILLGSQSEISQLVLYLSDHDVIITQNTHNNLTYEGYDYTCRASYKVTINEEGKINELTIDLADTAYETLNLDKILGLKWFTNHYLEKNEDFFKEIKENVKNTTYHHSTTLDLGEWKVSLFIFPLNGGKIDISLHFLEDAAIKGKQYPQNTASLLKYIYKELGCIERSPVNTHSDRISYKLPYYKLNANESIYYNSFINKNDIVYKTQFIVYKNGFKLDYKDIPQLKQIITLVSHTKSYPFDKLTVQFKNLKESIMKDKKKDYTGSSSWSYKGVKTVMNVERYATRDQCRIKLTVFLEKK